MTFAIVLDKGLVVKSTFCLFAIKLMYQSFTILN